MTTLTLLIVIAALNTVTLALLLRNATILINKVTEMIREETELARTQRNTLIALIEAYRSAVDSAYDVLNPGKDAE